MSHWLYPANVKFYDVLAALDNDFAFWPINSKVEQGDTVIIYLSAPYKQIAYSSRVAKLDFTEPEIRDQTRRFIKGGVEKPKKGKLFMKLDQIKPLKLEENSPLSFEKLKENGLNGALMGPRKLENNVELFNYIQSHLP